MLSIGKIFWLLLILAGVWYGFKIIERRKIKNDEKTNKNNKDKTSGIDAYKCKICGLWSTGNECKNSECFSRNK